ncbi:MAG: energy-coupling factor transporter ATPase [Eubacteriaceae bacterium]|nr:energy-coupling factor transporter ATPase [Eubacteriaceae bacterium]
MALEIKQLSHIYSKGSPFESVALKDIDAVIENGEFIGLIGHTGSGKSTLIQHLNGILKPTSGTVYIDGKDVFAQKKKDMIALRHAVGLVFQYPEHQLFEETVYKDVAFGPKNLKLDEKTIDRRVRDAVALVGLPETVLDKSPFSLSGGQMRRVAIAGVVAMEPQILILDEPTAGLDPHGRDEILREIKKLHAEKKMTVILVSHSMEDISRIADRILVLHQGEKVFFDTPAAVFREVETLEKIGLAAPEISYLIKRLRVKYPEIPDDIFTVEDAAAAIDHVLGGGRRV